MIDPVDLVKTLGSPHAPTEQQAAIIAADPHRPAVVIAGAGSGKTTTMSDRVLWLIASGAVEPHQILGLTFTRKAAAALSTKIRIGISALASSSLVGELEGEPTVLTYHAYGQRVLQEHSLRIGVEPPARTVREAAMWQMTERIVSRYSGDMGGIDKRLDAVVEAVIALTDQMSEHSITSEELVSYSREQIAAFLALSGRQTKPVTEAIATLEQRLLLLPIVEQVLAARRQSAELTFGDQMTMAARLAADVPEVGQWERARYQVVLLDEYQDTSQSQLTLMRSLFGDGHSVMAVGDPLQAIYGWRGASTGTIEAFPHHFPARDGTPADQYLLTTSWRNDATILQVANHFADSLRTRGFVVHSLSQRPDAGTGVVNAGLYRTQRDEAEAIGDWLVDRWQHRSAKETFAILVRSRSQIEAIERALLDRQLPIEVVGVAGLLATPEVIELHSMLQILFQPTAGPAVMRVLTGPRWRIGASDLAALHRYARRLTKSAKAKLVEDEEIVLDSITLIEALDSIERAPSDWFSASGRDRLVAFAREMRHLRRRSSLGLAELIVEIERVIGLNTEIAAMPRERAKRAQAHLDSFLDQAHDFAAMGGGPVAFLSWLQAAQRRERGLSLEGVEVRSDAIQILTIHAAKGLEWENVVIPGLRSGSFPMKGRGAENWLEDLGVVPFPLRGDKRELPALRSASDMKDLAACLVWFDEGCKERGLVEEERLAYVALTRPKHALLLTSSWWASGTSLRGPSEVFLAARDVLAADAILHDEPHPDEEVVDLERESKDWPVDPLGPRRADLASFAEMVRTVDGQPTSSEGKHWLAEAEMLLRERQSSTPAVYLPSRLSVSALVQLHSDPHELARRLRRPMPFKPDALARRGTAFHRWLEERFASQALFDLDEIGINPHTDAPSDLHHLQNDAPSDLHHLQNDAPSDLHHLQEVWLASSWAARTPAEVEVPFDDVVDGLLIRGRMDAVYFDGRSWEIVDWKTGAPKSGKDLEAAAVQLAMYRLAWSRIAKVPLDQISAAFHHVAANVTVRPTDLLDEAGLVALIRSIPMELGQGDDQRSVIANF
jgi:DNA helicase II / ATP-dependent DNA helicase PcrA